MKHTLPTAILLGLAPLCHAGPDDDKSPIAPESPIVPEKLESPFEAGRYEVDFTGSYFSSPAIAPSTSNRPKYNWSEGDASWGLMLNSPSNSGWLRGNFEFLANPFAARVTRGPGNYMAGGRALFRYNFIQPESVLVPYFQAGGGGLADDAFDDRSQRAIGGGFEFTLVRNVGLRYFVSKDWALLAQCGLSAYFQRRHTPRQSWGLTVSA